MVLFRKIAATSAKFGYLEKLAVHIEKVAHVPVRNVSQLNLFTTCYRAFNFCAFKARRTTGAI